MSRIAVFPGSFDPFTIGHEQIVRQALALFDKVIIAMGVSLSKTALMSVEDRIAALRETFADESRVEAVSFSGLVVTFAKERKANFLIRGLRSETDLAYELPMAHTNRQLDPQIQTIFFPTAPDRAYISSTLVREIVKNKGNFSPFVPAPFVSRLQKI